MPLVLRIDIDKPYGHHHSISKILSKVREYNYLPALDQLGYLEPTKAILLYLNKYNIPAYLYFRHCTLPNKQVMTLINEGNYVLGFHAENTRSIDSFESEFNNFKEALNIDIKSFTKHGNGVYKSGKNHYPLYEPLKYLEWADRLSLSYTFGNGIAESPNDLISRNNYFPNMFWLETAYRRPGLSKIEEIATLSAQMSIPIVVHPANFIKYSQVKDDLTALIQFSKRNNIEWTNSLL